MNLLKVNVFLNLCWINKIFIIRVDNLIIPTYTQFEIPTNGVFHLMT